MPTEEQLPTSPRRTVEDELGELLAVAGLNTLQRGAVARRLGWDGNGGTTLEAAGNGELTRERVRQLEERVRDVSAGKPLAVVTSALDLLADRAPIAEQRAAELLAAEGICERPFNPAGLINAARFAGLDSPVSLAGGCVYAASQSEQATRINEVARKQVSSNGATSVTAILDAVDDARLDIDLTRRVLELNPKVEWLDEGREWLFLPTARNRAANHLRKMVAVAPCLSVSDVREGFRRYDGREVILPRHVVRKLCACFEWIRVDGDRIAAAVPLDYRDVLENTEETLVDIFRENGPVLDRATTVQLGADRGLDRTTVGLYLGWSPIIERVATNRYALRGDDIPAGTLEAMRGASQRQRVQRGYGWTSAGRLWVGYTLSQAVIDSHVVGVPSALKHELKGRFELAPPDHDLGQLTTDGENLWGLSRLLKRYAAEVGDALVVEFDLSARTVHPFIGGQELLDPENRPEQIIEETETDDESAVPGDELQPIRPKLFDDQLGIDGPSPDADDLHFASTPTSTSAVAVSEKPIDPERLGDATRGGSADVRSDLVEALAPTRTPRVGDEHGEPTLGSSALRNAGPRTDVGSVEAFSPSSSDTLPCVVPGCGSPGKHKIGVRCRVWVEPSPIPGKVKTSALWAPDSDAFLCDEHALGGAQITLIYEPNETGETALKVIATPHLDDRRTPIRLEPPGSGSGERPSESSQQG
jgi:hypothetical protein